MINFISFLISSLLWVQVPQWSDDWSKCSVDVPDASCHWYITSPDNTFGEIHPKLILDKTALKKVYLFSINVANLLGASTRKNKWIPIYKQYPIVPKMERDINFIFNKEHLISEITSEIRKTGKNLLEDVNLIDVFKDINFGEDFISYTFRLSYRDKDKTLLDSDITSIHSNIISNVEKCFNTKLRN